jgi:hypothetical protein
MSGGLMTRFKSGQLQDGWPTCVAQEARLLMNKRFGRYSPHRISINSFDSLLLSPVIASTTDTAISNRYYAVRTTIV